VSLRFLLLGHPIAHSLSPVIHHAAYHELGLSHRYELVDAVEPSAVESAVADLRAGRIAGANVTVPWKREALAAADRADPSAGDVGAANVLLRDENGEVVAHNTDVPALAQEIGVHHASPLRALVLGSGGAALAAVAALRRLGTSRIGVSARRFDPARPATEWPLAAQFSALGAELVSWSGSDAALGDFAAGADVIVQATSAGMHGAGPGSEVAAVVPWSRVASTLLAYDVVYNPAETEFLRQAKVRGCAAVGGLGMLVGQAALAFELWLGVAPPVAAMRSAAEAELVRRGV
jgi:shikimate dehydrogenase